MDTTSTAGAGEAEAADRQEVVANLRRQVGLGRYEPPADMLAERIVQLVLAHREAALQARR